MPVKLAPIPNRDELFAAVRILFGDKADQALQILEQYDGSFWKESRERVQMAVLALSEGTLAGLQDFVAEANRDYRNVLYWSEYTRPGNEVRLTLERRLADAGQLPWAGRMPNADG